MPENDNRRVMTVAATQMSCGLPEENIKKAESLVRIAASRGAQVVVLQELFQHPYFPVAVSESNFQLAQSSENSSLLRGMTALARELKVVLPISYFEKHQNNYYSSVAMIDADGTILGTYRKAHLASRLGYQDKYYFTPSSEGFKVWQTKYGRIGVGISSDQWFPEAARDMVINGAEIIVYPSAMGNDPFEPSIDVKDHWQRVMQGHAAANMVPIVASNRVGVEGTDSSSVTFCGSSFITGPTGEMLKIADRESEGVLVESFNLDDIHVRRASFGLLRDRRPSLYRQLSC